VQLLKVMLLLLLLRLQLLRLCSAVPHRLQYIAQMLAETAALHKQQQQQ
jgi:hypothetical protein